VQPLVIVGFVVIFVVVLVLVNTEDRIQAARRFFNGNVRDYRNKCETFPSSIIAGAFGFQPEDYFQVSPSVREVPDTNFG
jgi:LemA protein